MLVDRFNSRITNIWRDSFISCGLSFMYESLIHLDLIDATKSLFPSSDQHHQKFMYKNTFKMKTLLQRSSYFKTWFCFIQSLETLLSRFLLNSLNHLNILNMNCRLTFDFMFPSLILKKLKNYFFDFTVVSN